MKQFTKDLSMQYVNFYEFNKQQVKRLFFLQTKQSAKIFPLDKNLLKSEHKQQQQQQQQQQMQATMEPDPCILHYCYAANFKQI